MEGGGVGAEQRLELRRACQVLSATAGFFPLDGRSDTSTTQSGRDAIKAAIPALRIG